MSTAATTTATGGTPGTDGTSDQAGQQQQTTPPAGGTPQAGTTSTTQGQGGTPTTGGTPGQPEDVAGLKSALRTERQAAASEKQRADAAEAELAQLRQATQTEAEKALGDAVKAAKAEVTTAFEARIRASEVRAALTAAGVSASELGLAAAAPEFAALKVTDDGVDGLAEAVAAFKAGHAALFTKPTAAVGDVGGGPRGSTNGKSLATQIAEAQAAGDIGLAISLKNRQMREKRKE